jgi:hypothetical protein
MQLEPHAVAVLVVSTQVPLQRVVPGDATQFAAHA